MGCGVLLQDALLWRDISWMACFLRYRECISHRGEVCWVKQTFPLVYFSPLLPTPPTTYFLTAVTNEWLNKTSWAINSSKGQNKHVIIRHKQWTANVKCTGREFKPRKALFFFFPKSSSLIFLIWYSSKKSFLPFLLSLWLIKWVKERKWWTHFVHPRCQAVPFVT